MMACNPKTIDNITDKFNSKALTTIILKPDYKGINKMMQILYSKMATLTTSQGGVHHKHIRIKMKPALYTTLMTTVCTNPLKSGVYPTIPMNATVNFRDQLQLQHDEGWLIYKSMETMDDAIKNKVVDAVEET